MQYRFSNQAIAAHEFLRTLQDQCDLPFPDRVANLGGAEAYYRRINGFLRHLSGMGETGDDLASRYNEDDLSDWLAGVVAHVTAYAGTETYRANLRQQAHRETKAVAYEDEGMALLDETEDAEWIERRLAELDAMRARARRRHVDAFAAKCEARRRRSGNRTVHRRTSR